MFTQYLTVLKTQVWFRIRVPVGLITLKWIQTNYYLTILSYSNKFTDKSFSFIFTRGGGDFLKLWTIFSSLAFLKFWSIFPSFIHLFFEKKSENMKNILTSWIFIFLAFCKKKKYLHHLLPAQNIPFLNKPFSYKLLPPIIWFTF